MAYIRFLKIFVVMALMMVLTLIVPLHHVSAQTDGALPDVKVTDLAHVSATTAIDDVLEGQLQPKRLPGTLTTTTVPHPTPYSSNVDFESHPAGRVAGSVPEQHNSSPPAGKTIPSSQNLKGQLESGMGPRGQFISVCSAYACPRTNVGGPTFGMHPPPGTRDNLLTGVAIAAVFDPGPNADTDEIFKWAPFGLLGLGLVSPLTASRSRRKKKTIEAAETKPVGVFSHSFGELLRKYRDTLDISLTALSKRIGPGFTISYLSQLERGLVSPPISAAKLSRLANALVPEGVTTQTQILEALRDAASRHVPADARSSALAFDLLALWLAGDATHSETIRGMAKVSGSIEEFRQMVECAFPGSQVLFEKLYPL